MPHQATRSSRRRSSITKQLFSLTPPKSIDELTFASVLGKGAFGKVFLARDLDNKRRYAVKAQAKRMVVEQEQAAIILTERRILTLPNRCPFIPHLFSCFQTPTHLFFAMEALEGGSQ